jgi:hypothetical protein
VRRSHDPNRDTLASIRQVERAAQCRRLAREASPPSRHRAGDLPSGELADGTGPTVRARALARRPIAVVIQEEEAVVNLRRIAVVTGTLCLLAVAALLVLPNVSVWAQGKNPSPQKVVAPVAKVSPLKLAAPDLVVTVITRTGNPTVVGTNVEVPISVRVRNLGTVNAGAFKVSTHYSQAGGTSYAVAFTVPGQSDIWYPRMSSLTAGTNHTFNGKLIFLNSVHGAVTVKALVDSCSGEEFTESWCHVKESNETNNESTPLAVTLP